MACGAVYFIFLFIFFNGNSATSLLPAGVTPGFAGTVGSTVLQHSAKWVYITNKKGKKIVSLSTIWVVIVLRCSRYG